MVRAVHADLRAAARDQIDPLTRVSLERAALGYLCALESEYGTHRALHLIDEYAPAMPNLAHSYLARFRYARGETALADAARRRFEVLSIQANSLADARVIELPAYLTLYSLADDLMGLTRMLHALEQVARTRPRWMARVRLARSHLLRCRGEQDAALAEIEGSLAELEPSHADWAASAALHVALLGKAGRNAEASTLGEGHLAQATMLGLQTTALELALAAACAEHGAHERAEHHFAAAHSRLRERGAAGLHMAHCLAVGASIAERRGDHVLSAQRTHTHDEHASPDRGAQRDRASLRPQRTSVGVDAPTLACDGPQQGIFRKALERLSKSGSFHAAALQLLCDHAHAAGGALYLGRGQRLERVVRTQGMPEVVGIDTEVAAFYARERTSSGEQTVAASCAAAACHLEAATSLHAESCSVVPYGLYTERAGAWTIAGMAVLAFENLENAAVAHDWLTAFAAMLANDADARDTTTQSKRGAG